MTIEEVDNLKPIPQYIVRRIEKLDKKYFEEPDGHVRFYAYLSMWKRKELIKITVAVKHYRKKLYMKQVAVHALHGVRCFVKDMEYCNYLSMGYKVGWYDQGISRYEQWYEGRGWCWANDKYYDPFAHIVNYEVLDRLSQFQYSEYKRIGEHRLFKYLRLYEQYPQAEMLIKFGLTRFAMSKQILRKVEKDKAFRKWLITHREEITGHYRYTVALLQAYRTGKSIKSVQTFLTNKKTFARHENYREIKALFPTTKELEAFFEYTEKRGINFSSYTDYIRACQYLGLDMSIDKNRFPHDFQRWHDIRIDEYNSKKAEEDAEKRKELYAQFAVVAEKYLPLQRNMKEAFVVIIARSPQELIREGDYLHHCVGRMNYDQRFIREESLIFFIRSKDNPDTPFVTVEYSLKNKMILQCYGEHDRKPNDSVMEFVNKKWLPYANRKLKQIAA